MKYEAHITFDRKYAMEVKGLSVSSVGWSFSQIDGDPDVGNVVLCYLNARGDVYEDLLSEMMFLALSAKRVGIQPIRTKVEQILFDHRWGLDKEPTQR